MDELIKYLEIVQKYSNNLLLVVVVLLWGVRKWVFAPIAKKLDYWEQKIEHYFEVHDESLFTTGRIERLLKEIHELLTRV